MRYMIAIFSLLAHVGFSQGVENSSIHWTSHLGYYKGETYRILNCSCDNGHYDGLTNEDEFVLIDCLYKGLEKFEPGLLIATNNDYKRGLLNYQGDTILSLIYDKIQLYNVPRLAELGDSVYVIRKSGVRAHAKGYISVRTYSRYTGIPNMIMFLENGKYGFMDWSYEEVIPAQYKSARDFGKGLAAVKRDSLFEFINEQGESVIPPQFTDADKFYEPYGRLAMVANLDSLYGFINRQGEVIIDFQFDKPQEWYEGEFGFGQWMGNAAVRKNGKLGLIDDEGKVLIPFEFDEFDEIMFKGGWGRNVVATKNGKCGVYTSYGKERVPPICDCSRHDMWKWYGETDTVIYSIDYKGKLHQTAR